MAIWDLRIGPRLGGGYSGSISQRGGSGILGATGAVLGIICLIGLPFAVVAGIGRIFITPDKLSVTHIQVMSWVGCLLYLIPVLFAAYSYAIEGGSQGPLVSLGLLIVSIPAGFVGVVVLAAILQLAHWPIEVIFWSKAPSFGDSEGFSYQAVYTVLIITWGLVVSLLLLDFIRSVSRGVTDRRTKKSRS